MFLFFRFFFLMVECYFVVFFYVGIMVYLVYVVRNGFGKKGFFMMVILYGFVDMIVVYV